MCGECNWNSNEISIKTQSIDDGESFEKIEKEYGIVFRPNNYSGAIAIDAIISEELKEYHRNSKIQVNLADDSIFFNGNSIKLDQSQDNVQEEK